MSKYTFEGRLWLLKEGSQKLISDIDTDQIFHNAHLHITDINEMGQYTFGNLQGWEDFPNKVEPDDLLLAGENFGAGSSRQQAVDCFKSLGVKLIVAESFGAIYKRNAINTGFPIMIFPHASEILKITDIKHLDRFRVELLEGKLIHLESGRQFSLFPFSTVQRDIFEKGSLLQI